MYKKPANFSTLQNTHKDQWNLKRESGQFV